MRFTISLILCVATSFASKCPGTSSLGDVTILAKDHIFPSEEARSGSALLLGTPQDLNGASKSCARLGETLLSNVAVAFVSGLNTSLGYEVFAGRLSGDQLLWVKQPDGSQEPHHHKPACKAVDVHGSVHDTDCHARLPALCSQTARPSNATFADTSPRVQVAQKVGSQTLIGYRDALTFRFMGVRFAQEPQRFTYSKVFDRATGTNKALQPAPYCIQVPYNTNIVNGSTDCLFLNVWTTKLPAPNTKSKPTLRPVMVYIYGGGYINGAASDPTFDGGIQAARGDVLVVAISYRLSSLGFFTLNDGVHNGNYFLSDCISGLQWVQKYIAAFGGDPGKVTIYGESAGAQTVYALMESPKAKGLFHGAIMQSTYNLPYGTIAQSTTQFTEPILQQTGCNTSSDPLKCLSTYNASALIALKTVAATPVVDGTYLTSTYINFTSPANINSVPVLMGTTRDEAGVLTPYTGSTNLTEAIIFLAVAAGYTAEAGAAVAASGIFPLGSGNNASSEVHNTTVRLATDSLYRCTSQYIAYAGVASKALPNLWFYEMNRTYSGPWYDPFHVCDPPRTPAHPLGDPELEYYKCHGGDLLHTFGNQARFGHAERDAYDLPYTQLVIDYWTSFVRQGDPNPDVAWLKARGYWNTLAQVTASGAWDKIAVGTKPLAMMELQPGGRMREWVDELQCAGLGLARNFLVPS